MFEISSSSSGGNTEAWLEKLLSGAIYDQLARYGDQGVSALSAATPVDSAETAQSWSYEIKKDATSWSIIWSNSHVEDGRPIAVLLQTGHGTGDGGYVQGRDYINPALRPVFDAMAADAWKVVTSG